MYHATGLGMIWPRFLRQFAFNTVIDVSRRELEALRHRSEESVTSFISAGEKISHIIDRPSENEYINMILRRALLEIVTQVFPTNSKEKKPLGEQRSGNVGAISLAG
ncbi:hypothetical protein CK203_108557 [Vitis vinifera]|uniref:Uncharacterized protein n=1 Tax=Vitis vinifera TaxID=29760 RepID=A0A438FFI9_VITVI|nr:hypothetical protein CK203_108557 [Vitis vinifera]